jgi:predicted outer membrane repeat protein
VLQVISGSLGLTNATISGGSATFGGGIFADSSTVSLTSATISGNSASDGGGIYARGSTVSVTSATISGNSAGDEGGGILSRSRSTTVLANSTLSGNSARVGGGLFARSGTASLTNVTVSGNSARDDGGGIFAYGYINLSTVNLTHATVTGNSAGISGGGFAVSGGALVNIQNSIVAVHAAPQDCYGGLNSLGYNIESGTSCGFTLASDQQSVAPAALDLGPLAPNAPGSTETHAIGAGSAALNQIPPGANGCGTTITTDQRGVARPQLVNCDIGAYELEPATPTPTPTSTPVPTPTALAPTAAQVLHFTAETDPTGRIRLTWETASEVDVVGFRLERSPADSPGPQGPPSPLRPLGPWTPAGPLVPARGHATGGAQYAATDAPGVGGFAYRLVVVEAEGRPATHGPVGAVVRALRAFLPVGWRE